jgi:hypothetical protein
MTQVEIIRRVCDATPEQLRAIEAILAGGQHQNVTPEQSQGSCRIKGENELVFELSENFALLKTFKNGKHLATEDRTLRAATRGYLEMLITNAGRFMKRSEIETQLSLRSETESASRISGKSHIYAAFRYTTGQGRNKTYTALPIYALIEKLEGWDPEYRIPAECICNVPNKKASRTPSRQ